MMDAPTISSPNPFGHEGTSGGGQRDRREYLLAELRCAILRARLAALDLETIGLALRHGMIDPDTAVCWVHDAGALAYVAPSAGEPS